MSRLMLVLVVAWCAALAAAGPLPAGPPVTPPPDARNVFVKTLPCPGGAPPPCLGGEEYVFDLIKQGEESTSGAHF